VYREIFETILFYQALWLQTGKGIAALQEAGRLPSSLVNFPRIDLLGIYLNLEGLGMQPGLMLATLLLLWNSHCRNRRPALPSAGVE
jgi:high-affinity iron transporter